MSSELLNVKVAPEGHKLLRRSTVQRKREVSPESLAVRTMLQDAYKDGRIRTVTTTPDRVKAIRSNLRHHANVLAYGLDVATFEDDGRAVIEFRVRDKRGSKATP